MAYRRVFHTSITRDVWPFWVQFGNPLRSITSRLSFSSFCGSSCLARLCPTGNSSHAAHRPQDDQHPDHLHLIVELTSPSQTRPAGYLPILQRISWHNIWHGDTSAAVYRVSGQDMRQLLAASSLAEWCGPSTRAMCRIQVERRLIPISAHIELQVGSLLEIFVSLRNAEDDTASFMQGRHILHTSPQLGTSVSVNHPHVSDRL